MSLSMGGVNCSKECCERGSTEGRESWKKMIHCRKSWEKSQAKLKEEEDCTFNFNLKGATVQDGDETCQHVFICT